MRPPESRSRLAAERASTAGWRSGRLSTLPDRWMRSVCAATQLSSVHVSWNDGLVRVVLEGHEVEAELLAERARATGASGRVVDGVTKVPNRRG